MALQSGASRCPRLRCACLNQHRATRSAATYRRSVRDHFAADWATSLVSSLATQVEKAFSAEQHRWPLLRQFDAEMYEWVDGWVALALRDRQVGGVPTISGSPVPRPAPVPKPVEPTLENIAEIHDEVAAALQLRPQDAVLLAPVLPGDHNSVEGDWAAMDEPLRQLWRRQLDIILTRHFYWIKGLDVSGEFFLPPGYQRLADDCRRFFADHPVYSNNVFLMTRFDESKHLKELDQTTRNALRERGLNPVRADDRVYASDRNLWDNVCLYMLCCSKGVAILEDRGRDEFNPNVALEYGFMRALNKPTLLLVDRAFRNLRADVIGTLREEFDLLDIAATVPSAMERWLRDLG